MKWRCASRGPLPAGRRWPAIAIWITLGSTVAVALAGGDVAVLGLAPPVLIALALSCRRYPGARLLVAMRSRSFPHAAGRGLGALVAHGQAVVAAPRGGLLLARSLAVRPPPVVLPAR